MTREGSAPFNPEASTADTVFATADGALREDRETTDGEETMAHPSEARFRVVDPVARGGMGSIHRVFDRELLRHVAMKVLDPSLGNNPDAMNRFVVEAQITGQLDHPNIVPVHELGRDDKGRCYFMMKLVQGRSLEAEIHDGPALPWHSGRLDGLLEILLKVCDALAFAHSRGVLHRDLKPHNIMVGTFGQVYLMDWGVALVKQQVCAAGAAPVSLHPAEGEAGAGGPSEEEPPGGSRPRALVGTPAYMSPEQALGLHDEIDVQTDVFMLGGILYEMLTRRGPYLGTSLWAVLYQAIQGNVTPPEVLLPEARLPLGLCRIAMKALAREKSQRYASVGAFKQALERYLRGVDRFIQRTYAPGALIVAEGDTGDTAFILTAGRCLAFKTVEGSRVPLREMGPGDVFGEMAVLTARPRTASVQALEETTVLCVTRESMQEQLGANAWLGSFVGALAQRFREADERLTELERVRVSRS
ncbi:MAG: cyclic nucleotide-binding domain-containing protein [Deltaproteobacteria bacterium]|nr:cyclic nucleotide-binding domain-containing protein [Deltaproteobacteria bacterium]